MLKQKNQFVIYAPELLESSDLALFDPAGAPDASRTGSKTGGRDTVDFLRIAGRDYVLRHYWRGGVVARVNRQSYLWLGLERSRPFKEWRLLNKLYQDGLPVPRPAAARVLRRGIVYRGDLLTEYLPATQTLAEYIAQNALPAEAWMQIGAVIRRFHQAGAYHADLNANNILLNEQEEIFLIDWDRGQLRQANPSWQEANLQRLARSLNKLAGLTRGFRYSEDDWQSLKTGYERGASPS